ncbi:MAG: winged helix-turn-helix domain-containing protein [Sphingomicrobium sp.]
MGDYQQFPPAPRIDLADEPDFELGGMSVRPPERAVLMGGERRDLQPRVMQVLVALAKARPAVVSRDKLIDLCWNGRVVGDDAVNRCVLSLRHLAEQLHPQPFTIETVPRVGHRLLERSCGEVVPPRRSILPKPWRTVTLLIVLAVATGTGLLLWQQRAGRVPTVLITAATSDPASRALAQDLGMKLGSLETAGTTMRLIGQIEGSEEADLILDVGRVRDPAVIGASVVLKAGPDGAILWSKQVEQPSRNIADLNQQIALTAARVLGCAAEASDGERLKQRTLKLYLNGCAAVADLVGRDAGSVIPMFREVLRDAPRFEAAWSKLLLADSNVFEFDDSNETRNRLKADLAAAREVNPDLVAVHYADIQLLPSNAFAERVRLGNSAVDLNPESADAYAARAQVLQLVGRMNEATWDAGRAMQLDPLSPGTRNNYIHALGAAGLLGPARHELQEAERLWPSASSVAFTRFSFNLRYGDPTQAWNYLRANPSDDWMNARSYLAARSNRTPENIERAIEDVQRLYKRWPQSIQHLIQVYGEFDRESELLELLLRAPESDLKFVDLTFRVPTVEFWRDPRALLVAKRAGLLSYWRKSGEWPDFCSAPDMSYDCKAEAAKIAS